MLYFSGGCRERANIKTFLVVGGLLARTRTDCDSVELNNLVTMMSVSLPVKVTDIAVVALALAVALLDPFRPKVSIVTLLDCCGSWRARKGETSHSNYCIALLTAEQGLTEGFLLS